MLIRLHIEGIALVDELDIVFNNGFTSITGETGAGKSVLLNSLALCLGGRLDKSMIRSQSEYVNVFAEFDIKNNTDIKQFLKENDVFLESDILKMQRIWKKKDGSSAKSFLNNKNCSLQLLNDLGKFLIDIHGQNAHRLLAKKENHRMLLDKFSLATKQSNSVAILAKEYNELSKKIEFFSTQTDANSTRIDWLEFQLAELSRYELDEESVQKVQDDLDLLSSSQSNIEMLSQIKTIARSDGYEENDIYSMINLASKNSNKIKNDSNNDDISRVIEEIRNKTEELCDLADSAIGNYPEDQKQLQLLEETMSFWLDFSRKCNCEVDELPKLQEDLSDELNELKNNSYSIEEIIAKKDEVYAQYKKEAGVLTKLRTSKVDELTTSIQSVLAKFNMGNMVFHIACYDNSDSVSIGGNESIEFLIASGPGYPLNSISKVASGGELSRISLAVQASLAEIAEFGTIVFDEVDVGIGGNTAQMVGEFLAKLGNKSQVLCITHQPQVASLASTQLRVHKIVESGFINTKILQLEYNQRVNEISRMIGDSSEYAVKLAKDMLSHIK